MFCNSLLDFSNGSSTKLIKLQVKFLWIVIKRISYKFWVPHKLNLLHFFLKKKHLNLTTKHASLAFLAEFFFLNNISLWTFPWQFIWFPRGSCWVYIYYVNIKLDSPSQSSNCLWVSVDFTDTCGMYKAYPEPCPTSLAFHSWSPEAICPSILAKHSFIFLESRI